MAKGYVQFAGLDGTRTFRNPATLLRADRLADVAPCIAEADAAVAAGRFAAGFLAYEAAPAFEPAMPAHPPRPGLPLAWLGIYDECEESPQPPSREARVPALPWRPLVDETGYRAAMARIKAYIAAGDTYQVNYTFPMEAAFRGDARAWFAALWHAQRARHAAFIDAGRWQVLSASPELFFRLDGGHIETRPMKGTRPRGRWPGEDRRRARELGESAKDRAENVMIVDLLRNDMGRIAETGTVHVPRLFDVERYETVWQMTSTVAARTRASVPEVLRALFPCGSVTGAPKIRTMAIIRELETFPRGVYCGSAGWWGPGRRAEFNVAIRSVTLDAETAVARYNVGGGITWDSTPEGEYAECFDKAAVLGAARPEFQLLETLLYDGGYVLLDRHLARLSDSAEYFGFRVDAAAVKAALDGKARTLGAGRWRVRLLAGRDGGVSVEATPAEETRPVRVGFATEPIDEKDPFLYHKTTCREVYEQARADCPGVGDVLLYNRRGEVTESTRANIVCELDGQRLTPPVASGLLAGTMRAELLARGEIREAVLTRDDVRRAARVWLVNSVRGWIPAELAGPDGGFG